MGSSLVEWFWLRVCYKVGVKLPCLQSSQGSSGTGESASLFTSTVVGVLSSSSNFGWVFWFHHVSLSIGLLTTWQLASLRATAPRKGNRENPNESFLFIPGSRHTITSAKRYWSQITMVQYGRELNKDVNSRRQESLGALLETGYHTERRISYNHEWFSIPNLLFPGTESFGENKNWRCCYWQLVDRGQRYGWSSHNVQNGSHKNYPFQNCQ